MESFWREGSAGVWNGNEKAQNILKMQMWHKMVRRLEPSHIGEVIKWNKDRRCVDLAVHNSATFIIPSVDGMGAQASQASAKIQMGCIFKTAEVNREVSSFWRILN